MTDNENITAGLMAVLSGPPYRLTWRQRIAVGLVMILWGAGFIGIMVLMLHWGVEPGEPYTP